jgi:hypothetical protein
MPSDRGEHFNTDHYLVPAVVIIIIIIINEENSVA